MAASSLGEHDFNSVHIFTLTFLSMVLASLRSHKGLVKKKKILSYAAVLALLLLVSLSTENSVWGKEKALLR